MRLAEHLTFRFALGVQAMSCLVGENPTCSVQTSWKDGKVYGRTATTATHDIENTPHTHSSTHAHLLAKHSTPTCVFCVSLLSVHSREQTSAAAPLSPPPVLLLSRFVCAGGARLRRGHRWGEGLPVHGRALRGRAGQVPGHPRHDGATPFMSFLHLYLVHFFSPKWI